MIIHFHIKCLDTATDLMGVILWVLSYGCYLMGVHSVTRGFQSLGEHDILDHYVFILFLTFHARPNGKIMNLLMVDVIRQKQKNVSDKRT